MPSTPHPTDPNYEAELKRQGHKPKKRPAERPAPQKPATNK